MGLSRNRRGFFYLIQRLADNTVWLAIRISRVCPAMRCNGDGYTVTLQIKEKIYLHTFGLAILPLYLNTQIFAFDAHKHPARPLYLAQSPVHPEPRQIDPGIPPLITNLSRNRRGSISIIIWRFWCLGLYILPRHPGGWAVNVSGIWYGAQDKSGNIQSSRIGWSHISRV